MQSINKFIKQGIAFLAKNQLKNGGFLSLSSPNLNNFISAEQYQTTFPASLILSSLNTLKETLKVQEMKTKIANFLLSQKSKHWSLNYFVRNSKDAHKLPFPDDLDDTFCALSALVQYNPKLIDASAMAKIVMLLTAVEEKEGGPYYTWLVSPDTEKTWKDIDLAVNSNVAYFLSLQEVELPNLTSFIETAIDNTSYKSPYYFSVYPVIYFISRFYKGDKTKKIINFLLKKQNKDYKWDNPLNTALSISSLFNLGFPVAKLEKSISSLTSKDYHQEWYKPYALGIDPAIQGKQHYCGSPTLTLVFCLEALNKYLISQNEKMVQNIASPRTVNTTEQTKIYNSVSSTAIKRCSELNKDLKEQALDQLAKTLKTNKDKQIVLLPYFFKTALAEKAKNISNEKLQQLGLANLYGWTAYTIYDDFLDDEGEPKLLSVANLMLRNLTTIFNNVLAPESGFHILFHKTMDRLDAANTWEVNNCRINIKNNQLKIPNILPDYADYVKISERSLGHMLGPIAILFLLGYTEKSSEVKNLASFFRHYLTARQLNDDAHDWEQDIKKGHINIVGAAVLKKWKEIIPSAQHQKADVFKIMPDLQKIFWQEVMPGICQNVLKQADLAEKSLLQISLISNPSIITKFLVPVRHSAQKALTEQKEAIKFLKAYNKS